MESPTSSYQVMGPASSSGSHYMLNGSNYSRWKIRTEAALEEANCLKFIQENVAKPTDAERRRKSKAVRIISDSLDDANHLLIESCTTPKEMWYTIQAHYSGSDARNLSREWRKYHAFRFGNSVSESLAELRNIINAIKRAGDDVSDENIKSRIIESLPPQYEALGDTLEALKLIGDLKLSDIEELLLRKELKLANSIIPISTSEKANESTTSSTITSTPKEAEVDNAVLATKQVKKFCKYCKKLGHLVKECRKLKPKNQQRRARPPDFMNFPTYGYQSTALACLSSDDILSKSFVFWLDSGCSEHVCFDKNLFDTLQVYEPSSRKTFSGYTGSEDQAVGVGTIKCNIFNGSTWYPIVLNNVAYIPKSKFNLLSLGKIAAVQNTSIIGNSKSLIIKRNNQSIIYSELGHEIPFLYKCLIQIERNV